MDRRQDDTFALGSQPQSFSTASVSHGGGDAGGVRTRGLSELSVQLRKLQATNRSQSAEIDRLERQLRILAELKGVSVSDIRDVLREACAGEAHGELRAVVGKLEATLEATILGRGGGKFGSSRGGGSGEGVGAANGIVDAVDGVFTEGSGASACTDLVVVAGAGAAWGDMFNREAAARAQADLELRIGELEELEHALRGEIDGLFTGSEELLAKNTELETHSAHQAARIDELERAFAESEQQGGEGIGGKMVFGPASEAAPDRPSYSFVLPDGVSPPPIAAAPILLRNAAQSDVDEAERARTAEIALRGEKNKLVLVKSQLSSARNSWDLRSEQFESRLGKHETDLRDLEQQLSSLYAAFDIMQNEQECEKKKNESLKSVLQENDLRVAQESYEKDLNKAQKSVPAAAEIHPHLNSPSAIHHGAAANNSKGGSRKPSFLERKKMVGTGKGAAVLGAASSLATRMTTPSPQRKLNVSVKPGTTRPLVQGYLLLFQEDKTPSSIPYPLSPMMGKKIPFGRNRGSGKSGKRQYCLLHGANGLYQLRYGDEYTSPINGVLEYITVDVSSVEHTDRSSKRDYGFEIAVNVKDPDAPVLVCGAYSEEDYMMWTSALMRVIAGEDEVPPSPGATASTPTPTLREVERETSFATQEELDHEMAMKIQNEASGLL